MHWGAVKEVPLSEACEGGTCFGLARGSRRTDLVGTLTELVAPREPSA
ncbi:hypothetical protein ACFORO_18765 [Amycolatopsis halotolerans]|uniref:Uncharacterized protein n=1 Tax=Amycolatopsis halotolerans TaxID=330083 RepID=A0ABV7QFX1_9PSEU